MRAKLITSLSALTLTTFAGAAAQADEAAATLAWQEPGYVMEVVIATAPRLSISSTATPDTDATLAWQAPGYVQEVVVATASRSEIMAAAAAEWRHRPIRINRGPFMGIPAE
jgi:hypothetical protein